jgi:hypothetical protein
LRPLNKKDAASQCPHMCSGTTASSWSAPDAAACTGAEPIGQR